MKVVILAGGLGTRLSEETDLKPKPMVEIGGKPILWHIMKIYSAYGFHEFVVCLGYKGYLIKEYFANYFLHKSDVTINLATNELQTHNGNNQVEPWKVTLVDTGINSMTGGRIKRVQEHVANQTFLLTYGDGLSNVNLQMLVKYHQTHKKACTVTAVQPSGRFGALNISNDNEVASFLEKPQGDGAWINGGFFVCESKIFTYIKDDASIWERQPLEDMARDGELMAFKHAGFWQPMDTLRDKQALEDTWAQGKAAWKIW